MHSMTRSTSWRRSSCRSAQAGAVAGPGRSIWAHWGAGVSYYKTALPRQVSCETGGPPPATAALLEALYSEGLGELAYVNGLSALPRPRFGAERSGERRG